MTKRECVPLSEIPGALAKTGFLLEHAVAEEFRSAGWTVIGNRYYVDDVDGKTRELDLVAYRVTKSDDLEVFTSVLVSCKKDATHTWAFLSKDKPASDPNLDWEPVHYWTDCEPIASYLDSADWRKDYIHGNDAVYQRVFNTTRNVFAFQLISPDGTAPKNDTPIFDSVTGLLKALDHELTALPNRAKGKKRLYLFTLLSVVDAPLVDVQYQAKAASAVEVEGLVHLARYIVRKRELSAQVHFVRSDRIKEFVSSMGLLSEHDFLQMTKLMRESFNAIRTNGKVRACFAKKLDARLRWRLNDALEKHGIKESIASLQLSYNESALNIELDVDDDSAKILNDDQNVRTFVKKALHEIARYDGDFILTWDIPF